MSINERVKIVRQNLQLTQIEFGNKTGISQGHLTSIESGKRNVTEKTIKVICATFNINEEWLRTGNSEMFLKSSNSIVSLLATNYNLDNIDVKILETYIRMPEEGRQVVKKFFCSLANAVQNQVIPYPPKEQGENSQFQFTAARGKEQPSPELIKQQAEAIKEVIETVEPLTEETNNGII